MLTGNSFFRLFRKLRMGGDGVSVRTLTGNLSLTVLEEQLCAYDPGGASRNVTIHVDDNVVGNMRMFYNSADADGENLVIKNSAGTTIVTIGRGETGVVAYGGSSPAWTKLLLTDGTADVFSTANTWSAEQTFGAGIALLDSDNITLGTGDDDTIGHDGTLTTWTHALGDLVIDNTDVDDQIILRVGTDTSATGVEIRNNSDAVMFSVVPASATTGTTKVVGTLDHDGALDQDVALTATGDAANVAATMNHATQVAEGLDVSIAQITNVRTAGSLSAIKASVTSLTGDTAGVDYYCYEAAVTVGEANADHFVLKAGAGFDAILDLSACATGEADVVVADNLASAFEIREAANTYLKVVTTNSSESIAAEQRLTTTDGVASGTARVVGGRHSAATADSTTISGGAGDQAFDVTASIPANTLKAGSKLRVRAVVKAVAQNGADTFQAKLRVGGTALVASGAVDIAANDRCIVELEVTTRAAPGAAIASIYSGRAVWTTAGTADSPGAGTTNLATNGALTVDVTIAYGTASAGNQALLEALDVEII